MTPEQMQQLQDALNGIANRSLAAKGAGQALININNALNNIPEPPPQVQAQVSELRQNLVNAANDIQASADKAAAIGVAMEQLFTQNQS